MNCFIISSTQVRIRRIHQLVSVWSLVLALALTISARAAEPTPITLIVDASEVNQHRIEARMVIPAQPGPMTLLYPKWLPGTHGPGGPIGRLGASAVGVDGQIHLFGGYVLDPQGEDITVPDNNVLSVGANRWYRGADIPVPVHDFVIGLYNPASGRRTRPR